MGVVVALSLFLCSLWGQVFLLLAAVLAKTEGVITSLCYFALFWSGQGWPPILPVLWWGWGPSFFPVLRLWLCVSLSLPCDGFLCCPPSPCLVVGVGPLVSLSCVCVGMCVSFPALWWVLVGVVVAICLFLCSGWGQMFLLLAAVLAKTEK